MAKEYIKIEVKKQQQLTKSETFDFCISSIKHRFFRSLLTLAVVVLAVAFFMYLLTENVIMDSIKQGMKEEIKRERKSSRQINLMFTKPTVREFNLMLSDMADQPEQLETISRVLGMPQENILKLAKIAEEELHYLSFFNNIKLGQRKVLVGRNTYEEIFIYLLNETNFQDFQKRLEPMGSIKFPGGYDKFNKFLVEFRTYQDQRDQLYNAWNKKIGTLIIASDKLTGGDPLKYFLSSAEKEKVAEWRKLVATYGFEFSDHDFNILLSKMQQEALKDKIIIRLNQPETRKAWRGIYGNKYSRMNEKMDMLEKSNVINLLKNDFTPEELRKTSENYRYENKMRYMEKELNLGAKTQAGALFSGRNIYLLVLSFIVCMVGIANAMLMSITERFREIATLKCLGATDSFILIQIMIEAGLQGLAGGAIGILIGLIITLLKDVILFGNRLFLFFPVGGVLIAIGASLFAGVMLSVLASIYPSLKASRMAPMEAMRIE